MKFPPEPEPPRPPADAVRGMKGGRDGRALRRWRMQVLFRLSLALLSAGGVCLAVVLVLAGHGGLAARWLAGDVLVIVGILLVL